MKISQTALDDHQIQFSVEVEAQTLESARQKAARKIAQRVKIPGFRPGKAPYAVIEKQVGAQAIKDEALDIVLDDMYPRVIEETGIKPYGPGTLEKVHDDKEPQVFEFRVPLSPEVKLGYYKTIRLPFEDKPVTEQDVENILNNLREQNAVLQPVPRAAQEGDIAYILLSAERQTPKDGKTALLPERRYPVVIEKEDVDTKTEWPFPGFSRLLIGLKVGEEKTFPHTFAKDSEYEDLRGEASTFKLKVEEIKDRQMPELDDAFAQSLGNYKTVADLHTEVEKQLTENYKRQAEDEYENRIVEQIIDSSQIKYPPQMLHHEIHHYIEDMEPDLAARGLDIETYLKSRQITMDQLEEEVSPRVEERLRKSLVIMEVSRQESIEVPESEVQDLVEEKINRLQQALSAEDMRRVLVKDNLQGLVSRTLTEEVIRRTLARLRAIAQGETAMEEKENPESVETK
ncbi:MAG TPA: trigger factor [Anaerolineales bacterium]|jgi:trigger factor|nr:trigger factor [Anaerolineales bacterium]